MKKKNDKKIILAIETSCDETAIALVEAKGGIKKPRFKILKNLVASQINIHRPYGGVVPNLAKREHLKNLPILFRKTFNIRISGVFRTSEIPKLKSIGLIAVTVGPGLEPALWTGINFTKDLQKTIIHNSGFKIPLAGASHLDGHLYSNLLNSKFKIQFPALSLIVSGGHTILVLMKDLKKIKKIGETVDDAAGEAFDKVARLLDLPYPGGPEIEKLAKKGNPDAINFPRPMLNQKNYNLSFSGLKTSVLYHMRDNKNANKADVAASFQKAAFEVLVRKTLRAAEEFGAKSIMISGGVAANKTLAKEFKKAIKKEQGIRIKNQGTGNKKQRGKAFCPLLLITEYPTDNAAMIAVAVYINKLRGKKYKLAANGNLNL